LSYIEGDCVLLEPNNTSMKRQRLFPSVLFESRDQDSATVDGIGSWCFRPCIPRLLYIVKICWQSGSSGESFADTPGALAKHDSPKVLVKTDMGGRW
jgi:hypothetical protein